MVHSFLNARALGRRELDAQNPVLCPAPDAEWPVSCNDCLHLTEPTATGCTPRRKRAMLLPITVTPSIEDILIVLADQTGTAALMLAITTGTLTSWMRLMSGSSPAGRAGSGACRPPRSRPPARRCPSSACATPFVCRRLATRLASLPPSRPRNCIRQPQLHSLLRARCVSQRQSLPAHLPRPRGPPEVGANPLLIRGLGTAMRNEGHQPPISPRRPLRKFVLRKRRPPL